MKSLIVHIFTTLPCNKGLSDNILYSVAYGAILLTNALNLNCQYSQNWHRALTCKKLYHKTPAFK